MTYLAIVKKVGDHWEIDADSAHLFEDKGGDYPVQEIEITAFRVLVTEPIAPDEGRAR